MTPVADTAFAARVRALCPGFEPIEELPARKSQLLAGTFDGAPVVAKRLARANDVWAWYFAREVAIYRAFAASPPPVRVPKLYVATDDVLVIERLPGEPLATLRSPQADLAEPTIRGLVETHLRLATYHDMPSEPPPPGVVAQLRQRFLEDPTAPLEWIRDGIARATRRGILPARSYVVDDAVATSHGDMLLRNVIGDSLTDWECAGLHHAEWDLALLWTQLAPARRPLVEAGRSASFLSVVAFALAREVSILQGFGKQPPYAGLARLQRELEEVCSRIP